MSKTEETESKTEDKTSDDRVKPSAPEEIFFQKSNNQNKPRWVMTDPKLRSFPFKPIHELESEFWDAMIKKYLYPLDENLKEKERIQNELEDLRNKSVFAFGFMNVIFILFVFMLQLHKDVFGVDIPVEITYNKTFDPETKSYSFEQIRKVTRMDPINFVLVIFFGLILIVQLIGKSHTKLWEDLKISVFRNVHSPFWNTSTSVGVHGNQRKETGIRCKCIREIGVGKQAKQAETVYIGHRQRG